MECVEKHSRQALDHSHEQVRPRAEARTRPVRIFAGLVGVPGFPLVAPRTSTFGPLLLSSTE